MTFSVGVLFSAQEFVGLVSQTRLAANSFLKSFGNYQVARADVVLEASQIARWVTVETTGYLALGENGRRIIEAESPEEKLRVQMADLIALQMPPWAKLIGKGRKEAMYFFPPEVKQCFKDAGLLAPDPDHEVVRWWDDVAARCRSIRRDELTIVGRQGERLSIQYELERTGQKPVWQAVESNLAGYDLLSRVDRDTASPLRIEVKASRMTASDAEFFLTKNEWKTSLETVGMHVFHLWLLSPRPVLKILTPRDLEPHVPNDAGDGEWETARIPFAAFRDAPNITAPQAS